jgi:hypothetical protein
MGWWVYLVVGYCEQGRRVSPHWTPMSGGPTPHAYPSEALVQGPAQHAAKTTSLILGHTL